MAGCDMAIAADDAMFGVCEINWGILPGGNVAWIVTQLMNYRDALHYSMTGEPFKESAPWSSVALTTPFPAKTFAPKPSSWRSC